MSKLFHGLITPWLKIKTLAYHKLCVRYSFHSTDDDGSWSASKL